MRFYTWQQCYGLYQEPYEVVKRDKPGQMWLDVEPPESCAEDEITMMMCAAGICGTDLRVYAGERSVPSGRIGHEGAAIIIEVGTRAKEKGYRKGMVVVVDCNHPDTKQRDLHLDGVLGRFYRVPADFVMAAPQQRIIPIDQRILSTQRISPAAAALIEPLTVVAHALDYLKRGEPKPREFYDRYLYMTELPHAEKPDLLQGKNMVIAGAGSIAVFAACLARIHQVKSVTLVNRDPVRLAHAARVAKPDYCFPDDDDIPMKLRDHFREKGGVDCVFVASSALHVTKAAQYLNPGGTILIVAGVGKEEILQTDTETVALYPLRHDDLAKDVVVDGKPIRIMGAHGTTQPLFHQVISYLAQGEFEKYGLDPLGQVTHIASLRAMPDAFAMAIREKLINRALVGKVLVDFRLTGNVIYTIEEYTTKFPRESREFLTGQGIAGIKKCALKSVQAKNAFSSIRGLMDIIMDVLKEKHRAVEGRELEPREWKFLEKAFLVAHQAYQGMEKARRFRPDGTQFVFHPLEMANYAVTHLSYVDPNVIAGILLHDVLEYTRLDTQYLQEQFGHIVSDIACDLAQDRSFEMMPLPQVTGYLQTNVFSPLPKMGERGEIVNLAIKNEHYTRLLKTPRHPLSPILKVLDIYSNYSFVRDLSPDYLRHRSQGELLLFRTFLEKCIGQYALPQVLRQDVKQVVALYEKAQVREHDENN